MRQSLDTHCFQVIKAMALGQVVPLLGAGANLCDRPDGQRWEPGRFLPSGAELSELLASDFGYPLGDKGDLVRVSEYVDLACGEGPLYEALRGVFNADYPCTALHRFLASLPGELERAGLGRRHQLVLTTNYDDALERAFEDAGEEFDLLVYMAGGANRGKFVHFAPGAEARVVEVPNEDREISLERRSVIVKVHGAVDRADDSRDSYVITEDHYIEYLSHTNLSLLIPASILARLMRSHFLFLGYSMRDWNLRVILHRIWLERSRGYKSWAVQKNPDIVDEELWDRRDVDVLNVALDGYVSELRKQLDTMTAAPAEA